MKKEELLFSALSGVSDDYLLEAQRNPKKPLLFTALRAGLAAALALVAILGGVSVSGVLNDPVSPLTEKLPETETTPVDPHLEQGDYVLIPMQRIPREESDQASEMLAFFLYDGTDSTTTIPEKGYFQYYCTLPDSSLLGEKVTEILGEINEWTSASFYTNRAGSVPGEIYAIKGIDPTFALCRKSFDPDSDELMVFVSYHGIPVFTGEDLFGSRLPFSGSEELIYETFDSWDWNKGETRSITGNEKVLTDFAAALKAAKALEENKVPEQYGTFPEGKLVLTFQGENALPVILQIREGGYVFLCNCPGIGFRIEQNVYDALLAALT